MLDLDRGANRLFSFPEYKSDVFKICVRTADACVTSFTGYAGPAVHSPLIRADMAGLIQRAATSGIFSLTKGEAASLALYLSGASAGTRQASNEIQGVDITFNAATLKGQAPMTPDRTQFNACSKDGQVSESGDAGFSHYTLTLHEIGHALGLSGFDYSIFLGEQAQPAAASPPYGA